MSVSFKKMSLIAFAALAGAAAVQAPVQAADPVVGYYAQPAVRVHRERPRVIRTTYIHREPLDCQTLKITEPDHTKFVKHCFPPVFDRS
ncbi:hypothetical protein EPK99_08765 [Neorhizobium lilium]|uniref:Secreted protein n=1 Tax=Neorhizobium lilium TaxID=2503024 RepID=A0A444LI10_9HYPH|nr:hypothetical protein [Neorhizobium lilium]RWX78676.1 hypothetical protein EPK99_08765 [Neorhizobium lilium]